MKKSLYFIFIIVCSLNLKANNSIFYFSNLNLKDGLSQLSVLKICEDSKGFMWFATRNGLNKYDGEKFIVYKHDNADPNSLSDNHITVLQPDNRNNGLWIGTTNGLNYIDLSTNRITSYNQATYPTMAGDEIISLSLDNDGLLWVGTRSGLCIFSPESNTFRLLELHEKLINEPITAIYSTNKGEIYIGTHSKGLLLCNKQMKIITYLSDVTSPSISANGITAIFEDSKKQIWIGTSSGGINKWDIRKNEITHFVKNNSGLTDNNIRCFEEQNSSLIVGTFDGLSILDLRTDSITKYNNFDVKEGNLSHFSVYSLYSDKAGTLWVGTYSGGVNYHNPQNNRFTFYHPQNDPNELFGIFGTMVYHPNGTLWMATEGGGLVEFDPNRKSFKNYLIEQLPLKTYNNNIIKSLMLDNEYIWCGTNKGSIYKFHIKTKTFSLYYQFDKEKNLGIYSIFRDKQNNLWIGTTAEQGLFMLTHEGKLINKFPTQNSSYPVSFSSIRSFMEVRDGVYLIGTRASGLFEYNTQTNSLTAYNTSEKSNLRKLQNNYITSLIRRNNGDIWIGTFGGGIHLYKEREGIIRNLNMADGLIDNNVCSIVECNNNLWISAGPGISELNTTSMQFRNYNRFNGIEVREFTPQGGICLPNGDLYFSGSNGFLSFNNYSLTKNKYIPPVVLTRLSINNKIIEPDVILTKTIDNTEKLILKHNQSNISIAYCALNYIFHQQNQYAYKLIGHDEEWNYVGTRKEAFYTNIAPGEYTFQVIASNNDGLWNKEGKSIQIIILPPWWKTPFAYAFYAILAITVFITIWHYINSKQKLEQDLRIKQVEKQKLEEFHQTKTRLFTNFSHELRTPLTLIISPLEEVLQQADLNLGLKQKLGLMFRNSQRLLLLVNQLMDLQKNQAGNMKLEVSQEDLNNFLLEIYYAFKQIADSKHINFSYEAPREEVNAYFDHVLLEKVVFNLLSNAFKFTKTDESIKLILRPLTNDGLKNEFKELLENEEYRLIPSGNYFLIQVEDTGKGIPSEERLHIFTPFYQVGDKNESNINGTGIGLSLTQSIVKLHHGIIGVKENKPKGSIFTIIIPMDKSAYSSEQLIRTEQEVILIKEETPSISVPEKTTSSRMILLVEDNEDIRNYLKESLSNYYQVIEAADGVEAFDKVLKYFPDLVISDIMMPGMDGLELCSLIKKDLRTGHIPVILITARTMVMHIKEGFLSGADDYIVKPFNLEVVLIRISNLLSSREKLKETYGKKFSLESMGIETTSADERFMQKFFKVIEEHLSDPDLNVEMICREIGFSRANFYRKLKAITELSPAELIKNKRLEIAVRMLHDTDMNISEISMYTGFSNPAYFAKCFKSAYGVSPTEYIQKQKKA